MREILVFLAALPWIGLAQDTGWLNPSADSGTFLNGSRAYFNDALFAEARNEQVHQYWGFAISLPAGSTVLGIEIRLDVWKSGGPAAYLYAELSWDGGTSWTTTGYRAGPLGTSEATYILGGPTDTWGRSWTLSELGMGLFRVRLTAECGGGVHRIRLDWVPVRVYYREPVALTLVVEPLFVDLGTLTLADYDAGYRELSPAQRITVTSGATWSLHVAANTSTWRYTGTEPNPGKPCSHLQWRVALAGSGVTWAQTSYLGMATTSQAVAKGVAGTGIILDIGLRLVVDYATTVPGTYELGFTYTLTTP